MIFQFFWSEDSFSALGNELRKMCTFTLDCCVKSLYYTKKLSLYSLVSMWILSQALAASKWSTPSSCLLVFVFAIIHAAYVLVTVLGWRNTNERWKFGWKNSQKFVWMNEIYRQLRQSKPPKIQPRVWNSFF